MVSRCFGLSGKNNSGKYFGKTRNTEMQRIIPLKPASQEGTTTVLLEQWRASLEDHDHSAGTVKKYIQAVAHFLAWYEQEEQSPL